MKQKLTFKKLMKRNIRWLRIYWIRVRQVEMETGALLEPC